MQLYGSLVGMFELNNLALTVPAPVARYKALLADPGAHGVLAVEAAAALAEVTPLLDALGPDADGPAEVRRLQVLSAKNVGNQVRPCAGVADWVLLLNLSERCQRFPALHSLPSFSPPSAS